MSPETSSVVVTAAGLTSTLIATWFAARSTSNFAFSRARMSGYSDPNLNARQLYEDEDGTAIEHSDAASSRLLRLFASAGATIALLISAANAFWSFLRPDQTQMVENWMLLMVFGQAIFLFYEPLSIRRFEVGVCIGVSCLALMLSGFLDGYFLAVRIHNGLGKSSVFFTLTAAQIVSGALTAMASTSLPRRPEVYRDGKVVDGQFTSSALGRYTFAWARPILDKAKVQQGLEYSDLPELDHKTRSNELQSRFRVSAGQKKQPLWYLVYKDHKAIFHWQWFLTAIESLALNGPQVCLYKILRLLEQRNTAEYNPEDMWLWVAGLGISKFVHLVLETWLEWINFAVLAVPIRSQLSTLVFMKSMNMKDVKGVQKAARTSKVEGKKTSMDADVSDGPEIFEMENLLAEDDRDAETAEPNSKEANQSNNEDSTKSQQEAINLLGVDAVRVSDFCGYNNLILGTFLKITISVLFLVQLIGWWSIVAGLAVPIFFTPLNSIASKHYVAAQGAVMTARDAKTNAVTEALQGIRQIKFSAIESQWQKIIITTRDRELKEQWRVFAWAIFLTFCWFSMPILLGAAALGLHAWLNAGISAAVAFTALAVFSKLEWSLSVVPTMITELMDARVSIKRIQKHLDSPEKQQNTVPGKSVAFRHASITWPSDEKNEEEFVLRDINLDFPKGELSVVHGKTGSGKSLLLAAILGEADVTVGKVVVPRPPPIHDRYDHQATRDNWVIESSTAFVAQIPWIENATIKDNVLFGLPFDPVRYTKVLYACALVKDLEMLPDGEMTEIGANGINLSGGQRWRVTFARALYSRAGILLLDDIFSAVDSHVGRHILEYGLTGELAVGRTRILVTHHIGLVLPLASYIVQLGDEGYLQNTKTNQAVNHTTAHFPSILESTSSASKEESFEDDMGEVPFSESEPPKTARKFVEEENRERGRIKWATYKAYMDSSGGIRYWCITVGVFILLPIVILGRAWWVKIWTENFKETHHSDPLLPRPMFRRDSIVHRAADDSKNNLIFYLSIYLGISIVAAIIVAIKVTLVCVGCLRASRKLFEDLTFTVLRAPLRWLDTVPLGRILNRFVGDFSLVDSRFAGDFLYFWTSVLSLGSIIIAALPVSPFIVIPCFALLFLCLHYTVIYLRGAREIKRLESSAKSPIFELYSSALTGLGTIRGFDKTSDYLHRMFVRIDDYGRSTWYLWLTTRWMSFRMGMLGAFFALSVATVIAASDRIDASLAGFALGFALEYSGTIVGTIRRYAGVELDMNSTERIVEYSTMPIEDQSGADAPHSWPSQGRLSVDKLEVGYAAGLPSVLNGLSFVVEPCQRVGVVGRTGSGKTSLTLALFRFLEARNGRIIIDGIDISKIKLCHLRSRMAIIPQDPVLFSGTLRSNLDPFDEHSDSDLCDALRGVHLLDPNAIQDSQDSPKNSNTLNVNIFQNLASRISQGGLNLSQGQRQLLCLARAIVARPKIIILDEATSAVDMATDALIQRSIREQFTNSTMLVIAHRLSTIADFDKVLVMSDGRAVEFGAPRQLIQKCGAFWGMLNESGEKEKIGDTVVLG